MQQGYNNPVRSGLAGFYVCHGVVIVNKHEVKNSLLGRILRKELTYLGEKGRTCSNPLAHFRVNSVVNYGFA